MTLSPRTESQPPGPRLGRAVLGFTSCVGILLLMQPAPSLLADPLCQIPNSCLTAVKDCPKPVKTDTGEWFVEVLECEGRIKSQKLFNQVANNVYCVYGGVAKTLTGTQRTRCDKLQCSHLYPNISSTNPHASRIILYHNYPMARSSKSQVKCRWQINVVTGTKTSQVQVTSPSLSWAGSAVSTTDALPLEMSEESMLDDL